VSVDQQRMIDTAVSFFLGGERCFTLMGFIPAPRLIGGDRVNSKPLPPHSPYAATHMCYAQASELFIKLLVYPGQIKKPKIRHDLLEIFLRLDTIHRSLIWENFENKHHGCLNFLKKLRPTYSKLRPTHSTATKREKKYSHSYSHSEVSRYPFELDWAFFETDFLREFSISCWRAAKCAKPDLISVFERDVGVVMP